MAITQISKITVRKGRKENLPQLAAGELGWAVDTQQLYIGNGTLSDGAPAEGNTEILTDHSATPLTNGFTSITAAAHVSSATPFYQVALANHPVGILKISIQCGGEYKISNLSYAYDGIGTGLHSAELLVGLASQVQVTVSASVNTNFIVFSYVNSGAAATINFKREDYL